MTTDYNVIESPAYKEYLAYINQHKKTLDTLFTDALAMTIYHLTPIPVTDDHSYELHIYFNSMFFEREQETPYKYLSIPVYFDNDDDHLLLENSIIKHFNKFVKYNHLEYSDNSADIYFKHIVSNDFISTAMEIFNTKYTKDYQEYARKRHYEEQEHVRNYRKHPIISTIKDIIKR